MYWHITFLQLIAVCQAILKIEFARKNEPFDSGNDSTYCGEAPTSCQDTKYRSYDGSCNNLNHSWWGKSYTPYARLGPNTYSDGVHKFPISITGTELPNVRTCSLNAFVDIPVPDELWTVVFMQYGQIIAHDMSLTADVAQTKNGAEQCCSNGKLTSKAKTDPNCAPILIPKTDPYNAPEGIKCMDFYRTGTTHSRKDCKGVTKVAEPVTVVTAILDLSVMYGSDNKTAKKVREFEGGRLAFRTRNGRELLPQHPDPTVACNVDNAKEACFISGDVRVNQNPELSMLHNLYLAQHNRMTDAIAKMNPHWDDEKLFQETRRIVIALHQHIVYEEYLPPVLGEKYMIDNKLSYPNEAGFVNDYDSKVNPAVLIEFAVAAFRVFHTQIVGLIFAYTEGRNISNALRLSDWLDKPSVCEQGNNFNGLTIGLATQPQSAEDRYLTQEVQQFWLKDKQQHLGGDLKAIDINRGRDHGVGTYSQTLKHYGYGNPKSFDEFKYISKEKLEILERTYAHYKDVDLLMGMSLETLEPKSLSGPTAKAVMGDQLKRARVGDRCFYQNGNGECAFTLDQLKVIRKIGTIAGLLCHNKGVKYMQAEAFKIVSEKNPLKLCSELPQFDPEPWREDKSDD